MDYLNIIDIFLKFSLIGVFVFLGVAKKNIITPCILAVIIMIVLFFVIVIKTEQMKEISQTEKITYEQKIQDGYEIYIDGILVDANKMYIGNYENVIYDDENKYIIISILGEE